jgi:capsular polysaccharide biosynthesis protein
MQRIENTEGSPGVPAMMRNVVAGLVLVGLMIIGVLAFAQKHHDCLHGRSIKDFKPCGSMSSSI